MTDHHHENHAPSSAGHWEAQYREGRRWSGTVNPTMADAVSGLDAVPGSALDLGCGEGGDAVWLAARGWQVTGVDISPTALLRADELAVEQGVSGHVRWVAADLAEWRCDDSFDLVTACFLHSRIELPRIAILRRAAERVNPGGHLVVVSHLFETAEDIPAWVRRHHAEQLAAGEDVLAHLQQMPGPAQELEELDLDPEHWQVVVAEARRREVTGPDGHERARVADGLIVTRRNDS